MAKFYAETVIDHGQVNRDGENERTIFEVGDEVTGLSKEDMKKLWDAGALRMVEDKEAKSSGTGAAEGTGPAGPAA